MGESKGGERTVGLSEVRKTGDDGGELGKEEIETFTKENEVGVAEMWQCQLVR